MGGLRGYLVNRKEGVDAGDPCRAQRSGVALARRGRKLTAHRKQRMHELHAAVALGPAQLPQRRGRHVTTVHAALRGEHVLHERAALGDGERQEVCEAVSQRWR